jgi:ribosome recycling factor
MVIVIDDTMLEAMDKMDKAVEHTQSQFGTVRTGRASPALVERITVEYYGALLIKPHDRSSLESIEKAIRESDLGVNPNNDGIAIRLSLPQLTEERRKEYVKVAKNMAEDGRITLRNIRRDARKEMEAEQKDGEVSEDELARAEKELDKVTSEHVDAIDAAFGRKEHELIEV